jgi:hypothetical protein
MTFTDDDTGERYEVHGTMDPFVAGFKIIKPIKKVEEKRYSTDVYVNGKKNSLYYKYLGGLTESEVASKTEQTRPLISSWQGKPLDQYTKSQLIEFLIEQGQIAELEAKEHLRELGVLSSLKSASRRVRIAYSCGVRPFHEHRYRWSATAHIWLSQRLPQTGARSE